MLYRTNRGYQRNSRRAFTLIELLLVVVILAVLAGLVVPRFSGQSEQTRLKAAGVDIANLGLALDAFEIQCGRYPTSEEDLAALTQAPLNIKGWQGPYLKKGLPKDPWGNAYIYRCPGQHNTSSYDLYSYGPDGQEGGGDDIDNWTHE